MNLDRTIDHVENLFQKITGHQPPKNEKPYAPLDPQVDPVQQIEKRMEQLFRALQDPQLFPQPQAWSPAISLWESEKEFLLRVDLPGVKKEDVDLSIQGQLLTIQGQRKVTERDEALQGRCVETPQGHFHRSIVLPLTVTTELHSKLENGVLELSLPKDQSASPSVSSQKEQH